MFRRKRSPLNLPSEVPSSQLEAEAEAESIPVGEDTYSAAQEEVSSVPQVTVTEDIARASPVTASAPSEPVSRPAPVRMGLLLLLLAIIGLSVAALLQTMGNLPPVVQLWWPLVLVVPAALWLLVALFKRRGQALTNAAVILGVGLSFLLDTQGINPASTTLLGIVFIAIGASIIVRGLLLGPETLRY